MKDDVSPHLLKNLADELAIPVTLLFRRFVEEVGAPDDWRRANVAPLHKKGSKSSVENYRPISLTST